MAKNRVSFKLKSNLSELDALCQNLEKFGQSMGLSKKCIFEANLALDELFTNIITYGFEDKNEHTIRITISLQDDELVFSIE
ncbi:MAG: ATP-binding protein, partial [Desulfobacterales bacterium]